MDASEVQDGAFPPRGAPQVDLGYRTRPAVVGWSRTPEGFRLGLRVTKAPIFPAGEVVAVTVLAGWFQWVGGWVR